MLGLILGLVQGSAFSCAAQSTTGTIPLPLVGTAVAVNPITNKVYALTNGSLTTFDTGTATSSTSTTIGGLAIAVNPVTNKIYVASAASGSTTPGSVYVIDGVTNAVTTLAAGIKPNAIAVNSVTNKIYVANNSDSTVTIIDGATNGTTTVTVGAKPSAVAVNPITNKIYVATMTANNLVAIDGSSNATTSVPVGSGPTAIAINTVTNRIYVTNSGSNTVTVVDGTSYATGSIATGSTPSQIAVNPMTNMIYTANFGGTYTVIDGSNNSSVTSAQYTQLRSVAINATTNMIYFTDAGNSQVISLNGLSGVATTVAVGTKPGGLAVNPVTNHLFVVDLSDHAASIVDCNANATVNAHTGGASELSSLDAVAVNPITHLAYVANQQFGTVSIYDPSAPQVTTTVQTGTATSKPSAVAVNPVTNKIYVANTGSGNVAIIDGVTNTLTTVAVGNGPNAIVANPLTNTVYVANKTDSTMTVINGATNATTTIPSVGVTFGLLVNPATNKVYAIHAASNNVSVIDGVTNTATTVSVGASPQFGAINTVTNKIYVANQGNGTVSVIDGITNATTTVTAGSKPLQVVVNPYTGKVYVANSESKSVTVIDSTNATKTISTASPTALTINLASNHIYVGSGDGISDPVNLGANISYNSVIDGASDTAATFLSTGPAHQIDVDPTLNRVFIPNVNPNTNGTVGGVTTHGPGDQLTVLMESTASTVPLTTALAVVTDAGTVSTTNVFQTQNSTPSFTATITNPYPKLTVTALYYQVDTTAGVWTRLVVPNAASPVTITVPVQKFGFHILYAFAAYGDEAGIESSFFASGKSPIIGRIAYLPYFTEPIPTSTTVKTNITPQMTGTAIQFSATVSPAAATGSVVFTDTIGQTTTVLGTSPLSNGAASFSTSNILAGGTHTITAEYTGDSQYAGSYGTVSQQIYVPDNTTTTVTAVPNAVSYPGSTTITAKIADSTTPATVPTGSVTFAINYSGSSVTLATLNLVNGSASLSYSPTVTGTQTLGATYNPSSTVSWYPSSGSASLSISQGTSAITWNPPSTTIYTGTPLGATLNATESLPSTITYTAQSAFSSTSFPVNATTLLSPGIYTLVATGTPTDTRYSPASTTTTLYVRSMNVFIANQNGTVTSLYNNGTQQSGATAGGGIGIAASSTYVWSIDTGGNSVSLFSKTGTVAAQYANAGLSGASALAIDGKTRAWIANGNHTVVAVLDNGVAPITITESSIIGPSGVAIDNSGNVWIANSIANTVDEIIGVAVPAAPLVNVLVNGQP